MIFIEPKFNLMKYPSCLLIFVFGMAFFSIGSVSAQYKTKVDAQDTVERLLESLSSSQESLSTKLTRENSIDNFQKEYYFSDLVLTLFGEKLLENLIKADADGINIPLVVKTTYYDLDLSTSEIFMETKMKGFEFYLERLKL